MHIVPHGTSHDFQNWAAVIEAALEHELNFPDAWMKSLNIDGFRWYGVEDGAIKTHVQVFGSNSLEFLQSYPTRRETQTAPTFLPVDLITAFVGLSMDRAIGFFEQIKVSGPYGIAITLTGVEGSAIQRNPRTGVPQSIDRDELWLKPMYLTAGGKELDPIMAQVEQMLYAAGGVRKRQEGK